MARREGPNEDFPSETKFNFHIPYYWNGQRIEIPAFSIIISGFCDVLRNSTDFWYTSSGLAISKGSMVTFDGS